MNINMSPANSNGNITFLEMSFWFLGGALLCEIWYANGVLYYSKLQLTDALRLLRCRRYDIKYHTESSEVRTLGSISKIWSFVILLQYTNVYYWVSVLAERSCVCHVIIVCYVLGGAYGPYCYWNPIKNGVYILVEVSFYISNTWWVSLLVDQWVHEGICSQVLRSTSVDS